MISLIIMRHAKSDWSDPNCSDHQRSLNRRGKKAAPVMAEKLQAEGVLPEIILASSAVRVQETLALMSERWNHAFEVLTEDALYLAQPLELRRHIEGLHDSWRTAMVVGHNPGLSALATSMAGTGVELPTAAVALFTSENESWKDAMAAGEWTLTEFWKPRELMS